MQPENVYRPVYVAGADLSPLDGKAALPTHTAASASQALPVDLQRLQFNQSPQLANQVASSFPQQGVVFPRDIAVLGQLDQSVPRMAFLQPLQMQQHGAPAAASSAERRVANKTRSQSDYASRHLAAEQRRRNRINERLERLRTIVPHAERTNTATFLEQVYSHIEHLNARVAELKSELEARDTTIQELMCSARGGATLAEGLNGGLDNGGACQVTGCPAGLMKDESVDVGIHDGGGVMNAGDLQSPSSGGDPWMGLKDGMKRGPMEADHDASKRMRTEA